MTIVRFAALLPLLLALAAPGAELDPAERAAGFRLLFDGETLDGWKAFGRDEAPPGWAVEEGTLARIDKGGDIATVESFGNFELRLEWRISEGGNSGIFYRTTDGTHRTGPEMQVLDDERHRRCLVEESELPLRLTHLGGIHEEPSLKQRAMDISHH